MSERALARSPAIRVAGAARDRIDAFAEGLGAAKAYAGRDDRRIDAGRELVALGGANLAAGVSSGMW